ncbi:LRR receptor-like serine/threonine-protein kinase RGI2 [Cytospora paraplurivora]|uniref:LRR receptor-like serine/threonine-protein kinase RGI2 n=1 Tax=Cytospora paraplurivora TaxID=2898453 RepID=A0AAN9U5P3_9PEZI
MVVTKAPVEALAQPVNEEPKADQPEAKAWRRNKCVSFILRVVILIKEQWLIIGFGLACLFGHLWPNVAATDGIIRSQWSIMYGAVAIIFLVSGMQLSPQKLRLNLANWRLHIVTQAIMWIIIAAGDLRTNAIETPILLGMLVLSCLPTTIASNVVMTRNAGGDDAAAIVEVVLGNVFGSFFCPMLIYGYIPNRPEFEDWRPAPLSGLSQMYKDVAMQLGLSVLIPIIVGQALRIFFEKQVLWCMQNLKLAKFSTFFLITLIWVTFSNAFKTGAIYQLPKGSIVFNILMNVGLYGLFTVICFYTARPPRRLVIFCESLFSRAPWLPRWVRRIITPKQMSREQAVAVCFCGAAKTTSVGIPLVSAMWAQQDELTRAYVTIPVMLYTMEQVFLAQILVYVFRHYLKRGEAMDNRKKSMDDLEGVPGEGTASRDEEDGVEEVDAVGGELGEHKYMGDHGRQEQHSHHLASD